MSVTLELPSTTLEYVRVPVAATEDGAAVDISATTVRLAFLEEGAAAPSSASADWKTAAWETDETTAPDTYYARALVGPGTGVVELAAGLWDVWAKITDAPEVVIRKSAGVLRIV